MNIRLPCLLVSVLLISASAASAQERMEVFLLGPAPGSPKALAEIDVGVFNFGAVRNTTALPLPPEAAPEYLTPVAGGRYLVWWNRGKYPHDPTSISIFDRRTRGLTTIGGGTYGLLADPYRPRVFSLNFDHISVFDFRTGVSRVAAPGARYAAYAGRADRLVLVQTGLDGRGEIQIVDVSTATTVASFPVALPKGPGFCLVSQPIVRVTQDGTMAYIGQRCGGHPIVAYDLARGIEVARVVMPLSRHDGFVFDDERQLLLVESPGYVSALHPTTLATLAVFPVALNDEYYRLFPGRGTTGALVFRTTEGDGSQCVRTNVDALDAGGQLRASISLLMFGTLKPHCRALYESAAVFRAPPPPTELQAQVVGNTVSLSWQNPDTLEFELEVGLAPGTTALRVPVGDNQGAAFSSVPPGTYYVRVRARNEVGRSPTSAELRVDVP